MKDDEFIQDEDYDGAESVFSSVLPCREWSHDG